MCNKGAEEIRYHSGCDLPIRGVAWAIELLDCQADTVIMFIYNSLLVWIDAFDVCIVCLKVSIFFTV